MTKKRAEALRAEWGDERYMETIAVVSRMYQDCGGAPPDPAILKALAETSPDAFQLFSAKAFDLADRLCLTEKQI